MEWIAFKDQSPPNEDRVLVCLAYHLYGLDREWYWISVGYYCQTRGWIVSENKTCDPVLYWAKLPDLPEGLSNKKPD